MNPILLAVWLAAWTGCLALVLWAVLR